MESGDAEAIREFYAANGAERSAPACGLVGKIVGDIVAVLTMEIGDAELRIDDLLVARDLRRKRIGRYVLDEAARIASKLERVAIVIPDGRGADDFLRRVGFIEEDGQFVRRVG